jgi:hypothetical protein
VLIVEQNANHALKLAHRGYVMVNGLITLSGTWQRTAAAPGNPRCLSGRRPAGIASTCLSPAYPWRACCGKMLRTDRGFARKLPMTSP